MSILFATGVVVLEAEHAAAGRAEDGTADEAEPDPQVRTAMTRLHDLVSRTLGPALWEPAEVASGQVPSEEAASSETASSEADESDAGKGGTEQGGAEEGSAREGDADKPRTTLLVDRVRLALEKAAARDPAFAEALVREVAHLTRQAAPDASPTPNRPKPAASSRLRRWWRGHR